MLRKLLISGLVVLGLLLVVAGAALWFRVDLLRFGAERMLGDQLTITRLEGLRVGSRHVAIDELDVLLRASGARVSVTGIDLGFRATSLSAAPTLESLVIASLQLQGTAPQPADAPAQPAVADATSDAPLLLSDVLTLLREFPLANLAIDELRIPQRSEALTLQLQRAAGDLSLNVDSAALGFSARFTQADAASTARLQARLTSAATTAGSVDLSLQPMAPTYATYALDGSGGLDIADLNALLGELQQAPLPLPLQSAVLEWDLAGTVANEIRGAVRAEAAQSFVFGIARGSTLTLPAGFAEGMGELTLDFSDRSELTITTGTLAPGPVISAGRVPLHVVGSSGEQAVSADAVLTLAGCEAGASLRCNINFDGSAGLSPYTVAGKIDIAISRAASAAFEYQVRTQGLALGGLETPLPPFDIDARIVHAGDALAFSTPLLLRDAPADAGLALDGTYDLAARRAELRAIVPLLEFTEAQPLSAWFSDWQYPFDLLSGSIAAQLDLQWQAAASLEAAAVLTARLSSDINEVGGFYAEIFFRGASAQLQGDIDTASQLPLDTPPLALTVAGIDVGLPMENLKLDLQFDSAAQQVHIASFSTELLDGTVTGSDISYDLNAERNEVVVYFSGLQIERMLDLIEYKGVAATGAISGAVPLTITPNGVEVAEGTLSADAPGGSIRYLAAAATGATGNPGVDMMNQALGNYQFESLTSSIEYTPEGELLLGMKLQGHNPDFQNGQRINLNLNLSDDVPALLESLRAARQIEDFLAEKYQ